MANPINENKLKSPNSVRPSSLNSMDAAPAINTDDAMLLEGLDFTPAAAPISNESDEALLSGISGFDSTMAPQEEVMPAPEGPEGMIRQLREAPTRLRLSFGVTAKEKVDFLKNSMGANNVRTQGDDKIQFRYPGEKKWRAIDNDTFEMVNDLMDFGRDAFEVASETGAKLVGVPLAGPVGGAAGSMIALNAGDGFAQDVIGIPRDPSRSAVAENAIAGGIGAVLPFGASIMARRAAAKKAAQSVTPNIVRELVSDAIKATEEIKASGLGDIKLLPHQLDVAGSVPEVTQYAKSASTNDLFRNAINQQKQVLGEGWESIRKEIGNVGTPKVGIHDKVATAISNIDKYEGALIGDFRDRALKASKGKFQPMNETSKILLGPGGSLQQVRSLQKQFGVVNGERVRESEVIQKLKDEMFPELKTSQVKTLVNTMESVAAKLEKRKAKMGQMTLEEVDREYTKLTRMIGDTINTSGSKELGKRLIGLKDAVRTDWQNSIGTLLGGSELQAYKTSLDRFSSIKISIEALAKAIKSDNISKEALSDYLFQGNQSLDRVRNLKNIIFESDQDLWRDVTGNYLDKIQKTFKDPDTGSIDFVGLSKELGGKKELMGELADGIGLDAGDIDNFLKVGRMFQKTEFPFQPKQEQITALRKLAMISFSPFISTLAKANEARKMLEAMGNDKAVLKYLNAGGIEDLLKGVPKRDRGPIATALRDLTNTTIKAEVRGTAVRRDAESRKPNQ